MISFFSFFLFFFFFFFFSVEKSKKSQRGGKKGAEARSVDAVRGDSDGVKEGEAQVQDVMGVEGD